jgi:hypothetical protein
MKKMKTENISMNLEKVDVLENRIIDLDKEILDILLFDQTSKLNILWCTNIYSEFGENYKINKMIKADLVTGKNGNIIKPRTQKSTLEKKLRIKENGEVFTPSWACNHQNNEIDEQWFDQKNVFNYEGSESWTLNPTKIHFDHKNWMDYVSELRLEITCGEAPYIISRYDTVTGSIIEPKNRIGLLDRKFRVINENVKNDHEWLECVKKAYQSVYGYEWQGDSLLIARENLLYTFIDYYELRFKTKPSVNILKDISRIISWNFWQMDGLKGVIPLSCDNNKVIQMDLFGEEVTEKCLGCKTQEILKHNGLYSLIMNWKENKTEKFINAFKGSSKR